MVNFKGGNLLAVIINGSAWTVFNLWWPSDRNAWLVVAFLIITVFGFFIMMSSITRYMINLKANPQSWAKLALHKLGLYVRKMVSVMLVAILGGMSAATIDQKTGLGAEVTPPSIQSIQSLTTGIRGTVEANTQRLQDTIQDTVRSLFDRRAVNNDNDTVPTPPPHVAPPPAKEQASDVETPQVNTQAILTADTPAVSLTFDDALASTYNLAAPILDNAGMPGVLYTPSGMVGTSGHMSWSEIQKLSEQGWEIAAHTVNHVELPKQSAETQNREIGQSRNDLKRRGFSPTDFATPYGAYDNEILARVAKLFNTHRPFHDQGFNKWPYNKYLLQVKYVQNTTTVETAKTWVDEAASNGYWLVVVFHDITAPGTTGDAYSWSTSNLKALVDYLNSKSLTAQRIDTVLASFNNALPNSTFNNGLTHWSTDNTAAIQLDGQNNGSYPSPKNSVRISGSTRTSHLFGPKTHVEPDTLYGFRSFVDTRFLNSGEVGFVVDEYSADGDWISWQWLGGVNYKSAIDQSFRYQPSSGDVVFTNIQVYITPNSSGHAFLDNIEFFAGK